MKTFFYTLEDAQYPYSFPQPLERIAFFDIETTGLSPNASSLYLIGLMRFDAGQQLWTLQQWFADDYRSEKAIIEAFLGALSGIEYLFHFNGKTFDIPYLLKKCSRHAISLSAHCRELLYDTTGIHSIDLLSKSRSLRHTLSLEKCSQTAIEQWLGVSRTDSFSGGELISVYAEYMQQKLLQPENASKAEAVLLLHNHDDIAMMQNVCSLLAYDEYLSDNDENRLLHDTAHSLQISMEASQNLLIITLQLPHPLPKEITLTASFAGECGLPDAVLELRQEHATLTVPLYHGTLRFFFPNYRDYYYLPKEDTAIHKSVAEFVDSAHRKKATAASCYTRKEGIFLPNLCPAAKAKERKLSPLFYEEYRDRLSFYELPKDMTSANTFWREYLRMQLPCFR